MPPDLKAEVEKIISVKPEPEPIIRMINTKKTGTVYQFLVTLPKPFLKALEMDEKNKEDFEVRFTLEKVQEGEKVVPRLIAEIRRKHG